MADDADSGDFVCPNCNAPVEEDWAACPSCGIDFAGSEEETAAAAPPPAPPAAAAPPKSSPPAAPPPPARAAPPAPPTKAGKPPAPPKAAKPAAPPKEKKKKPAAAKKGPPLIGPLIRKFGIIGFLGLGLAVVALAGYFVVMNYDTLLGGQSVNFIGEQQKGFMNIALMVFAVGAVVTVIGLFRARSVEMTADAGLELAEAPAAPAMESAGLGEVEPPLPPSIEEILEPPVRAAPPVSAAFTRAEPPPAAPARPPAVVAAPEVVEQEEPPAPQEDEEEEEEEVAIEIPSTTRPPEAEASAPASSAAAAANVGTSDELEDLFGELESEVQAAEAEEDVLYECPNCHGMVKEDDTSCPHCHVTFEG